MKISILFLIGLISSSCQNQANESDRKDEEVKVQLIGIDDHPNKEHMEWFLNNYEEEFITSEVDWKILEHDSLIQKEYHFHTKLSNVSLTLTFYKNQEDALTVADANFTVYDSIYPCGVNGGVLFMAQGDDQYKVNDVLSWFAGEE